MISVKICYQETGRPVEGAKVCLGFDGFCGGMSRNEYTNSSGDAHFDHDSGVGTVYVNGTDVQRGQLSGRIVVYI
jgi:hypothetical protein